MNEVASRVLRREKDANQLHNLDNSKYCIRPEGDEMSAKLHTIWSSGFEIIGLRMKTGSISLVIPQPHLFEVQTLATSWEKISGIDQLSGIGCRKPLSW